MIYLECLMETLYVLALLLSVNTDYYVQGDVGVSHLSAKSAQTVNDVSGRTSILVGAQKNQFRYAADYTYFGNVEQKAFGAKTVAEGEIAFVPAGNYGLETTSDIETHSLGVSAFYDFENAGKLTPYVGARLGVNHLNHEVSNELRQGFADYDLNEFANSKVSVGAGVMAGASYQMLPQIHLDAKAEFNHLGKVENTKVNQYGATVGVRYQF